MAGCFAMTLGWLLVLGLQGTIPAQQVAAPDAATPMVRTPSDVTFGLLAEAPLRCSYRFRQVRRLPDARHAFVAIHESLSVVSDGSPVPPSLLEFESVEGVARNSKEEARWISTYQRVGRLFQLHGGFGVRDAAAAAANYTLHPFGPGVRAGRPVQRFVVFPRASDKAIWLIDVDVATGLVTYSAEYDSTVRLLGELEVKVVEDVAHLRQRWLPRMILQTFETIDDGITGLQHNGYVQRPDAQSILPEYVLSKVHTTEDTLNGEKTLVVGYTDGIDEVFVLQTPGAADPFAALPSQQGNTNGRKVTIARFVDASLRVYTFHRRGSQFRVVGRGSLVRLDRLATHLLMQADSGR
jgi:hypothetical protein